MTDVWAGIVRVSVVGGRAGESFHSDREQTEEITRAVNAIGGRIELLPPELDVSGGLPLEQRPSLLAAVEGVEAGQYAGIVVSYLSRLGRNVREQLRAWDRVEAAGGRIIVVREAIDTSTPHGRMHRTILLAIAEAEREQLGEQWAHRKRVATEQGIWRWRVPIGYDRDPVTRRLVPNDDAGRVVELFRRRLAGHSVSMLAEYAGMTTGGISALLQNPVYLGEIREGGNVNENAHPPVVPRDLWVAVQASKGVRPPRRADGPRTWLAGLVRCQECGFAMGRNAHGGRCVFICRRHHSAGVCERPAAITATRLEAYVEPIVRQELSALDVAARQRERSGDGLEAELAAARAELAAYLDAVGFAGLSAGEAAAGLAKRKDRVRAAQAALDQSAVTRSVPALDAVAAWDAADVNRRGVLARSLIDMVIVKRSSSRGIQPVEPRVRVIAHDSGIVAPRNRGPAAQPLTQLPFPDLDSDNVLRVVGGE